MAEKLSDYLDSGAVDSNVTNAVKRTKIESSDVSDFDSAVSSNSDVANNTVQRHNHPNGALLDSLTDSGAGDQFLADDGTYKTVQGGGGSETFTGLTDTPDSYAGQQGKLIKVNATEDGLIFGDPSGIVVDRFTGDGSTTTFSTSTEFDIPTVMVLLNGVALVPGEDVDVSSGNSVVFSTAPADGDTIAVYMVVGEVGITTVDWGNIGGTLSNQTDLQSALDLKVSSDTSLVTNSNQVNNMVYMTQADYDALDAYDAATLYIIVG